MFGKGCNTTQFREMTRATFTNNLWRKTNYLPFIHY